MGTYKVSLMNKKEENLKEKCDDEKKIKNNLNKRDLVQVSKSKNNVNNTNYSNRKYKKNY